jgi:UDP-N-acetylglucosamine 2-epimerase (non-hydrolysing)
MILICYGTRPEWIKVSPLIKQFKNKNYPHKVLFTGQQKDIASSQYTDYNYKMEDLSLNRLDSIIKNCMSLPEHFFDGIKSVLVQGDTATAFGIALSAFHRKIKVIHLEAGLRTHDKHNPYPEEVYRQMIARIADVHLCPTFQNMENLKAENCSSKNFYVVGNTSIDNLKSYNLTISEDNTVLVTLHRRENHDIMESWFTEIDLLAKENPKLDFVLPIHPNPNVLKHRNKLECVKVVDPLDHESLVKLVSKSKMIITDSGGIQEEASFYNKKIIVCRRTTERIESIGITSFLCQNPSDLKDLFYKLMNESIKIEECPYGKGNSSENIVNILINNE